MKKLADYRACGTELLWVIHPKKRTITIGAGDQPVRVPNDGDRLKGGTVIPGFECTVAEVFEGIARG